MFFFFVFAFLFVVICYLFLSGLVIVIIWSKFVLILNTVVKNDINWDFNNLFLKRIVRTNFNSYCLVQVGLFVWTPNFDQMKTLTWTR